MNIFQKADEPRGSIGCISVLVVLILLTSCVLLYAAPGKRYSLTAELVDAAHRILDLGYDCAKSGAERVACHAQLTTAIKDRIK